MQLWPDTIQKTTILRRLQDLASRPVAAMDQVGLSKCQPCKRLCKAIYLSSLSPMRTEHGKVFWIAAICARRIVDGIGHRIQHPTDRSCRQSTADYKKELVGAKKKINGRQRSFGVQMRPAHKNEQMHRSQKSFTQQLRSLANTRRPCRRFAKLKQNIALLGIQVRDRLRRSMEDAVGRVRKAGNKDERPSKRFFPAQKLSRCSVRRRTLNLPPPKEPCSCQPRRRCRHVHTGLAKVKKQAKEHAQDVEIASDEEEASGAKKRQRSAEPVKKPAKTS